MLKTPFTWNDQNTTILLDMLKEGRAASQAAAKLGCSRNACIGKARRMGFFFGSTVIEARLEQRRSTRTVTAWTEEELQRASGLWNKGKTCGQIGFVIGKSAIAVNAKAQDRRDLFPFRNRTTHQTAAVSNTVRMVNRLRRAEQEPVLPPSLDFDESVFDANSSFGPVSRRLTLLTLSEHTCKWPNGDPVSEEFHFCGAESPVESPYCNYHHRLAYRPRLEVAGGKRA